MRCFLLASLMGMLIGQLAFGASTDVKSTIGGNDLNLTQTDGAAQETFVRRTSTGGTVNVNKIDGNDIPWTNEYTRTIRPGGITGNSSSPGRIQNYNFGSASFTDNGYLGDLITKGPWVDVRAGYGTSTKAVCDGVTDDGAALNSIIDNVPNGYKIILPGVCKTTVEIDFAGKDGLVVEGKGWPTNGSPVTSSGIYYAGNAGRSAVSLAGARDITFRDFEISSSATTPPKTLLLLGRTSGGSFGTHNIDHVKIKGYATQALVYSIASEGNVWGNGTYFNLDGGGGKYVYYTSFQDNLALGGLTSSTNTTTFMSHLIVGHSDPSPANSATFYIQTTDANATDFKLRDVLVANGGTGGSGSSYIEINMAGSGGPFGKIVFDGFHAEGGAPTYGLKLTTDSGTYRTLTGLTLINSALNSVTTNFLYGSDNTNMSFCNIEYNYYSKPSSVYDFDLNRLQYNLQNFTVRNHSFQNDITVDDTTTTLSLGSSNKNRVFYQKSGTNIASTQGALVIPTGFSASFTPDLAAGSIITMTLTDNTTFNAPTNGISGSELTFSLTQDGTGGRVVTWAAAFKQNWTPNTAAGKINSITFFYDGTNWIQTSERTGM